VGRRSVVRCNVAAGSALLPMTVRSRPRSLPNVRPEIVYAGGQPSRWQMHDHARALRRQTFVR